MDRNKQLGQYFTPKFIADFMGKLLTVPSNAIICEPSVGEGVFLQHLSTRNFPNVKGYEIDHSQFHDRSYPYPVSFMDFLDSDPNEKFDAIIGNPPYVRWRNLPVDIRKKLATPFWQQKIGTSHDLLYYFLYWSVKKLKDNGELIFITPITWWITSNAVALREYMIRQGEFELLIVFNEMAVFDNVSAFSVIFRYRKSHQTSVMKYIELFDPVPLVPEHLQQIERLMDRLNTEIYIQCPNGEAFQFPQFTSPLYWHPIPPDMIDQTQKIEQGSLQHIPKITIDHKAYPITKLYDENILTQYNIGLARTKRIIFDGSVFYLLQSRSLTDPQDYKHIQKYCRLSDICRIANGMQTGLDEAFELSTTDHFSDIEKNECMIPMFKAIDAQRYGHYTPIQCIFVPRKIRSDNQLQYYYPNVYNHLISFKEKLNQRYVDPDTQWWEWAYLRNYDLMHQSHEKIVIPSRENLRADRQYVRFAYVNELSYSSVDMIFLTKRPYFQENMKYIVAWLNSTPVFQWIYYKGTRRARIIDLSQNKLSMIPFRFINWQNPKEVQIHDQLVTIVTTILHEKQWEQYQAEIDRLILELLTLP